ncbi:MAG: hypothetical protein MMC33_000711 [Icmadophila ericetorum]|nr:hypothetical protein [Icmadophila ericetorum]
MDEPRETRETRRMRTSITPYRSKVPVRPTVHYYQDGEEIPIHIAKDLRKYWLRYKGDLRQLQLKIVDKHNLFIDGPELHNVILLYYQAALGTEEWDWSIGSRGSDKANPSSSISQSSLRPSSNNKAKLQIQIPEYNGHIPIGPLLPHQSAAEPDGKPAILYSQNNTTSIENSSSVPKPPPRVDKILSRLRQMDKHKHKSRSKSKSKEEEIRILEDFYTQIAVEQEGMLESRDDGRMLKDMEKKGEEKTKAAGSSERIFRNSSDEKNPKTSESCRPGGDYYCSSRSHSYQTAAADKEKEKEKEKEKGAGLKRKESLRDLRGCGGCGDGGRK